ncbi:Formylglycine-generating sulfatase enzyme [Posidoniimonas polymericola]|uniref:Formylglycine-generating sulfatase enzyme n=1 Tax=Posidoniimonas polymericola TaxID=2528002 RepID=A0A5C5XUH6_9BACT|nr:Formylglycine-generating sulfatase enzyme [Posidoniimonas polymericola]
MWDKSAKPVVIEVPAGSYHIGDELVPDASPRHEKHFAESFWIDRFPVSWRDYETFVAGGGYGKQELWRRAGADSDWQMPDSVDASCRGLIESSGPLRNRLSGKVHQSSDLPLTGLSWFAAQAFCSFFSARLPFESEWEAAMQGAQPTSQHDPFTQHSVWRGSFSCECLPGLIEEWTADAFSPCYWRADGYNRGHHLKSAGGSSDASVRGAPPGTSGFTISWRKGKSPNETSPYRGFRRVWDMLPSDLPVWGE